MRVYPALHPYDSEQKWMDTKAFIASPMRDFGIWHEALQQRNNTGRQRLCSLYETSYICIQINNEQVFAEGAGKSLAS